MKIRVNPLNTNSIDNAIKEVERQKEFIHEAAKEIVRQLTDTGTALAKELCPVDTGAAQASIIGYVLDTDCIGYIKATGEYIPFLEFGTGIKGKGSPHPSPEWLAEAQGMTGYNGYLSGKHIFTTKDGRVGWIYPADDGKYYFTEGIESQHFMYDTFRYLKNHVGEVARSVLNGKG